jgi:hypothetical protein
MASSFIGSADTANLSETPDQSELSGRNGFASAVGFFELARHVRNVADRFARAATRFLFPRSRKIPPAPYATVVRFMDTKIDAAEAIVG